MVELSHLISHRFRGFAPLENTLEGFDAALSFGVQKLEFDIRVTRCGTPVIYHDEFALDAQGQSRNFVDIKASSFNTLGGRFSSIPTADALFQMTGRHDNQKAQLLIDIKDAGFETEIHALVCLYRLQDRVTYVSWLPDVLYSIHDIAPQAPLCLSHWCQNPDDLTRYFHDVYVSKDGHVPKSDRRYSHGERSGWYVKGSIQGDLRERLKRTRGSVCVPQSMVTRDLVEDYHTDGIEVSTFSYTDWDHIRDHKEKFDIDLYFIDNKTVFDDL